jgi:CRP/FNR family transcriptional regulator, cyclic AMP receptor protein
MVCLLLTRARYDGRAAARPAAAGFGVVARAEGAHTATNGGAATGELVSRIGRDQRIELLHSVWLFSRCSRRELAKVTTITTVLDRPAGTVLTNEGDPGEEFFVVVAGKASVTRRGESLGELGPGSFFGEMALLDRAPRVATVVAGEDMTLLVMSASEFDQLIDAAMPSVARKMLRVLGERLRNVDTRLGGV